jgi:hypothetical protein
VLKNSPPFSPVPENWVVLLFDIVGSTKAVAAGAYKQVNMVGAMCVASALRHFGRNDVPFVFGGDGATILIEESWLPAYKEKIQSVIDRSRREFGLEIRVGYVRVAELRRLGKEVLLRQTPLGKTFARNDFLGGGLDLAESLIKSRKHPAMVIETQSRSDESQLDLEGLECRWEPILSKRGLFHTVIVKARDPRTDQAQPIFQKIIDSLGARESFEASQLKISTNPFGTLTEIKAHKAENYGFAKYLKKMAATWLAALFGRLAMAIGIQRNGVEWKNYPAETVRNTDRIKMDDALRFVVDLSYEESESLEALLGALERQGMIYYAIQKSPRAQLTCFVSSHADDHIHFIDGANGGYTMAAKALKSKIAADRAMLTELRAA